MKEIYTHQTALNNVNISKQQTITKTHTKPFVYEIVLDLIMFGQKRSFDVPPSVLQKVSGVGFLIVSVLV